VWSRKPLEIALTEVARQATAEVPISPAYRATRNLELAKHSIHDLPADDWRVVIVELDHRPLLEEHP
jgi:hypothetical protein